jgi:hypothetical protein
MSRTVQSGTGPFIFIAEYFTLASGETLSHRRQPVPSEFNQVGALQAGVNKIVLSAHDFNALAETCRRPPDQQT